MTFENFPTWMALLSSLVSISIYAIGAYVLSGIGILFSILYLIYCLWIEIRVLRVACVNCYYYGRVCGLGRGRVCSLFFKRGDPRKFVEREASLRQILPDFMVSIFPIVGGIILLVRNFTWLLVAMLAILVILSFWGTAVIRGSFACKYCKQREIGCPAEKLFSKEKRQSR